MFESIYVPVDNSEFSNRAMRLAVDLGARCGSKLVGSHVYAASMHDYRFKQMEYTLPEEYLQERELERQRKIHDSLITMGLELISDSYLDTMETACAERGLDFERKMMDGKHYVEIVKDIHASNYGLVILGAQGIGKVRDSQLGSVCAHVTRETAADTWVVKQYKDKDLAERDTILVAVDGSPQSFGGLLTALSLAKTFDKKVELISVYDPYLHYSVFNGIVNVLSEKAKKVFRFEEQNQLHEEIIDTGLAQIYQSHLNVAASMAAERGVEAEKTLLDGKAFQKILDHVRKTEPWLLVMGRIGVHSEEGTAGLGNATENLLRMCPCDMYLSARAEVPKLDVKAEETIIWSDEAKERMKRVPSLVRGIARTGILRMAIEKGHSVVTDALITEAMEAYMPKYTRRVTEKLAESLAFDRAKEQTTSMCKHCGVTAKEAEPVRCSVCGAQEFETITAEMIDVLTAREGGAEEETSFDGRKLKWTREARLELRSIEDKYQMRRVKARVEKSARIKRLDTITLDGVRQIIADELGSLPISSRAEKALTDQAAAAVAEEIPVVGRDENGHPMHSHWTWNEDALQRMLRVPAGFMRERTQQRVEEVAAEREAAAVTMTMVEEGLERGREMMNQLLAEAGLAEVEALKAAAPQGVCPFHAAQEKARETEAAADGRKGLNEVGSIHFPVNKPQAVTES